MKFSTYLTIKEALTEGGNSTLGGIKAQSIPLKLFKDVEHVREFQNELVAALLAFSKAFGDEYGQVIWPKGVQFSGSTDKFFDANDAVLKRLLGKVA